MPERGDRDVGDGVAGELSAHSDDYLRSLGDPAVRQRRRDMLTAPHSAPLTAYAASLRGTQGDVPNFDPLDGGTRARILFLLEKPGPMTDAARPGRPGSGFVSRHTDDPTAAAIFTFMQQAAIPPTDTVLWNVIPWWNGRVAFTSAERAAGLRELTRLLTLLPWLHTAVLVGRTASAARAALTPLRVWQSAHPSPQVRAANRSLWDAIPGIWREAATPPISRAR